MVKKNFEELPDNPSQEVLEQYSRAYLLYMLGTLLFLDMSGGNIFVIFLPLLGNLSKVHEYGWGVAVLFFLYAGFHRIKRLNADIIHACAIILEVSIIIF